MSVTRRVFPEAFKREAVDRVATSGLSAGAVARELGLHETVLRRWMMQFGAQATGTPRRPTTQAVAPIKAGQQLGTVTITLNGKPLRTEPLVALKDVPEGGLIHRLSDSIRMLINR